MQRKDNDQKEVSQKARGGRVGVTKRRALENKMVTFLLHLKRRKKG